jgi:hypothetical protein
MIVPLNFKPLPVKAWATFQSFAKADDLGVCLLARADAGAMVLSVEDYS